MIFIILYLLLSFTFFICGVLLWWYSAEEGTNSNDYKLAVIMIRYALVFPYGCVKIVKLIEQERIITMTHNTHRMPLVRLLRFESATGHKYNHTVSKADPSIVRLTQAEIDRIMDDLVEMAETCNRRRQSMRSITFTIPGDPQGKQRPRFSGRSGHAYTPSATTDYENKVRLYYSRETRCTTLHGEIRADIRAYFRIPKSLPKYKQQTLAEERTGCTKAPDADNIAKVVLDALNGLAYEDDKAVTYLTVGKLYGATPRVEVTLTEVEG